MKNRRTDSFADVSRRPTPSTAAAYPRLAAREADACAPALHLVERVRELGQTPASGSAGAVRPDRWVTTSQQPERWDGLA